MDFERQPERDQPRGSEDERAMTAEEHAVWLRQWEELLEQRERTANDREALADRRERAADEREAEADQRALAASEREEDLRQLEQRIDARARTHGVGTATLQERLVEAIERSRALVASSRADLNRSEEALGRQKDHNHRHQELIDRLIASAQREAAKSEGHVIQSGVEDPKE